MRQDLGIGLGLLAVSGVLYWQVGLAPTPPFVPFGPAFYPRIVLILLACLAVWLIVQDIAIAARRRPRTTGGGVGHPHNYRLVFLCFTAFATYILGLSLIGFLAGTFLFVLGLSWLMGPRNQRELPKLVAIAAGTTLLTSLVFEEYLHVFLPRGLLF